MAEERGRPGSIPRQPMPEQDPAQRTHNFDEVALGYTEEQAVLEASRCLGCKRPLCVDGCPVKIAIPEFIAAIHRRDFAEAARIVRDANSLPAICGRVCPQEEQCEQVCVLARRFEPVAIGRLERFVADWEAAHVASSQVPHSAPPTGFRVAVVGSGPAGLTAAGELAKMGHDVTVFEALHEPGGVLVYGIPEFRLPKRIVRAEVEYLRSLGVKFRVNTIIGRTLTVDDLLDREGFHAVFLGTGAGLPVFLNIPGENLNGVYSANEFLTRVNLMKAYLFPQYDTPIR
ncbi:MAG: NAD(P)-binding protein, partial [Armatimonadota bacterium]